MENNEYSGYLSTFELKLEAGITKICTSNGLLDGEMLSTPDVLLKWDDYIRDYVGDAVQNYTSYPDAALCWAAYLGMGVTGHWDRDWALFKDEPYSSYYGTRGWDDMDEHVTGVILKLGAADAGRLADNLLSCSAAVQAFIRREGIEAQTAFGFYALVRAFGVMYKAGVAMELRRLGYKMTPAR